MKQLLVALVVSAVFSPWSADPAFAGEVEHGEHIQVYEEMTRMAQRTTWKGVETHYQRLLELEFGGEPLTYEDHFLGAEAARALGDMTACRERLRRAAALRLTPEVEVFLAEIAQNFGMVNIRLDARYDGPRSLAPAAPPFAPDQRANIVLAETYLGATGGYEGLLPVGSYTLGGITFSVGAAPVTVLVPPLAAPAAPKGGSAAKPPAAASSAVTSSAVTSPAATSSAAKVEHTSGGALGGVLMGTGAVAAIGGGSLFALATSRGWEWSTIYAGAKAGSKDEARSREEIAVARQGQLAWGATAGAGVLLLGIGTVMELRDGPRVRPVVKGGVAGVEVMVRL